MASPSDATPNRMPSEVIAWLHHTSLADMPRDVVEFGRRCLLDLLGVAASGRTTKLSTIIHDHAVDHFGAGATAAPLLFDGRIVSPAGAALAGGMTIDSIDAHDGHKLTKGHSGCSQLPALLAIASATQCTSGADFVADLIVGYEIATRAGIALHATVPDYHTSGAWGAVGAAALGARLLKLDNRSTFEALGIAEYHGPRSQMMRVIDHPTMLKDGSGWGAMAGVSAAYLAAAGFTGAPAVTVNAPAVEHLWCDLGERWIIMEQYFKPYPVCRWAQPAVEAVLALRSEYDVRPVEVDRIEVATFHEAARLATTQPSSTEQAQYSLPFPVAAALSRGRLGAAEVTEGALDDQEIRALAQRVTMVEDPDHNAAFPANRYARVTLHLNDGRTLASPNYEPRGDPEAHLSDTGIRSKFHALSAGVLGRERALRIEDAIDGLVTGNELERLLGLIYSPIDQ